MHAKQLNPHTPSSNTPCQERKEGVISIIMAVYNAAQYLDESISSVLAQTHQDWELLCVDDASTDNSVDIVERYAATDSRIKLWRQAENQGQAVARNRALAYSEGDIIMFLDADDWLSNDALEQVARTFHEHPYTGCVLFQCHTVDGDKETPYSQPPFDSLTGYDAFVKSLTWQIHGVYAVRADIHLKYPYDTTCRHFSDDNTTRLHYYSSREVRECSGIYYYRYNPESVSNKITSSRLDYLRANESMRKQLIELHCSKDIIDMYENHRWLNCLGLYRIYLHERHRFTDKEKATWLTTLQATWQSIDTSVLIPRNKLKFGYYPFRFSWRLFCLQETLFCWVHDLVKAP